MQQRHFHWLGGFLLVCSFLGLTPQAPAPPVTPRPVQPKRPPGPIPAYRPSPAFRPQDQAHTLLRMAPVTVIPHRAVGERYVRTSPLSQTIQWALVSLVISGRVDSLELPTPKEDATKGDQLLKVMLEVSGVHKGDAVELGVKVPLEGWATGERKQDFIPGKGDHVVAFVHPTEAGRFDLLSKKGLGKWDPAYATPVKPRALPAKDGLDWLKPGAATKP